MDQPCGNSSESTPTWRWVFVATLPALLLVAWQVQFVWPFVSDDAYISLRYAARLLAGHGLSWTDGERVEGYSNLLWVLGCAGLGALGLDLVDAARALGAAATVVGCVALAWACRPRTAGEAARAALAPLAVATSQVALGWTLGGLEGPLVFACLATGYALLLRQSARAPDPAAWPLRRLVAVGLPFALACWTRPDTPLWVAATAAALAWTSRAGGPGAALARAAAFAALPVLAVGVQLAFRLAWHGDVVPNTAHVKAGFAFDALPAGAGYVGRALFVHLGLAVPAALAAVAAWRRRGASAAPVAWLAWPLAAWLLYLVAIGGDHFPGRRLLHGALAPFALLTVLALVQATRARAAVALLLLAGFGWNVWQARTDAQSIELRSETWEWQGRVIGRALRTAFADTRPLLAVDAAGAIPYESGLPSLDLLGLCDRTIARTPEPAWLDTMIPGMPRPPGHLKGNGRYVLGRDVDVFLFGPPPGRPLPVFVSGAELEEEPAFRTGYRLVLLDLGAPELLPGLRVPTQVSLWLRVLGRAGVQRSRPPEARGEHVIVPGYLFGAFALATPLVRRHQPPPPDPNAAAAIAAQLAELQRWLATPPNLAVPDATGRLGARLATRRAELTLPLDRGRYRAALVPAQDGVRVLCPTATADDATGGFVVRVAGEHTLRLEVADAVALPLPVAHVLLVRVDD